MDKGMWTRILAWILSLSLRWFHVQKKTSCRWAGNFELCPTILLTNSTTHNISQYHAHIMHTYVPHKYSHLQYKCYTLGRVWILRLPLSGLDGFSPNLPIAQKEWRKISAIPNLSVWVFSVFFHYKVGGTRHGSWWFIPGLKFQRLSKIRSLDVCTCCKCSAQMFPKAVPSLWGRLLHLLQRRRTWDVVFFLRFHPLSVCYRGHHAILGKSNNHLWSSKISKIHKFK